MVSKEQANKTKEYVQITWPELSFGLTKDGDDYAIAARGTDQEALSELPSEYNGVKIKKDVTGNIKAL